MAKTVGPGSNTQEQEAPKPLLEDAHEYEYITLLNPLTDDFQVMVAQDVPVNLPFEIRQDNTGKTSFLSNTERDVKQVYGLGLKNPDHQAKKYIHNIAVIPAGGTMNFRGNEAKVAIRQLVTEILQREGSKRLLHDPFKRNEVEQRVILKRGSVQDLMDINLASPQAQAAEAVERSNEVTTNDQFPQLRDSDTTTAPDDNPPADDPDPAPERQTAPAPVPRAA